MMFSRAKLGKISTRVKDDTLYLEQVFPASREDVFQAFIDQEQLKQWWGPIGWQLTYCKVNAEPGGQWHYCMTCTDSSKEYAGEQSWGKAIYDHIEQAHKIVYRDYLSNEQGEIATDVKEAIVTVTFEDQAKFTRVKSEAKYASKEELEQVMKMGLVEGITQTWSKLDQYLKANKK